MFQFQVTLQIHQRKQKFLQAKDYVDLFLNNTLVLLQSHHFHLFDDNELQYILWKARNRITNKDTMKEMLKKNNKERQIRESMFPTHYPPKNKK